MWGSTITREKLEESINRLARLNEVPEEPRETVFDSSLSDSSHRLSLERENEISSNLAFLAATSDDSLKVKAACIEEDSNGTAITIRISSNTGDLSEVMSGFRRLASVLERAARRETPKIEAIDELFREIVAMDMKRILSRLRSKHVKAKRGIPKPALINQLNEVLNDPSIKPSSSLAREKLPGTRASAKAIQVLFTQLENLESVSTRQSQAQDILRELILAVHALISAVQIEQLTSSFRRNPSLQSHLAPALGKLARYYTAATELISSVCVKKTSHLFHTIHVWTCRIAIPTSVPANDRKIHAEIQLLFYYEMHPEIPRPRIIAASKSACYLCNLFFTLHSGFSVPRTHGKIYKLWMLPEWIHIPDPRRRAKLRNVVTRLNHVLGEKITTENKKRGQKRICHHPNESILLPSAHYSPSSVSATSGTGTATPRLQASRSTTPRVSFLSVPNYAPPPIPSPQLRALSSTPVPKSTLRHVYFPAKPNDAPPSPPPHYAPPLPPPSQGGGELPVASPITPSEMTSAGEESESESKYEKDNSLHSNNHAESIWATKSSAPSSCSHEKELEDKVDQDEYSHEERDKAEDESNDDRDFKMKGLVKEYEGDEKNEDGEGDGVEDNNEDQDENEDKDEDDDKEEGEDGLDTIKEEEEASWDNGSRDLNGKGKGIMIESNKEEGENDNNGRDVKGKGIMIASDNEAEQIDHELIQNPNLTTISLPLTLTLTPTTPTYTSLINPHTPFPSLRLKLPSHKLNLTLKFTRGLSGRLSITHANSNPNPHPHSEQYEAAENMKLHVIDVEDIPTMEELGFSAGRGGDGNGIGDGKRDGIIVRMRRKGRDVVDVSFIWAEDFVKRVGWER